ncbi:MAG: OB-fold nucleic acid binding domain-containing protein [Candidatus Micrarchaeota archaeon]
MPASEKENTPSDSLESKLLQKFSSEELGKKIAEKQEQFANLLTREGALLVLARETGVLAEKTENREYKLSELTTQINNIKTTARILRIFPVYTYERNGKQGKTCRALLAEPENEVPVLSLVLWNNDASLLENGTIEKGDLIQLDGAYTKGGELHLAFDGKLRVMKAKSAHKIKDLEDGPLDIAGRVYEVFEQKTFKRGNGSEGKLASCSIFDETGKIRVVFWGEHAELVKTLVIGDYLKIEDAICRNSEIQLNARSRVIVNPRTSATLTKISDLKESMRAEIQGKIKKVEQNAEELRAVVSDGAEVTASARSETALALLGLKKLPEGVKLETLLALKKDALLKSEVRLRGELKKVGEENLFAVEKVL